MKKRVLILISLLYISTYSFSQDVRNVDFTFSNNTFVITYDLENCSNNYIYDVNITLIGEETGKYLPKTPTGALTGQFCGYNKEIIWKPLLENKEINERVKFIVTIISIKKLPNIGPSNAFKSMLLPGLGSLKVQKTKLPLLVTMGFLYTGFQAYNYNVKTNSEFDNYLNASNQNDMNLHYLNAQNNRKISTTYLQIAAGIWVTDVVYTLVKGSINKHKLTQSTNNYSSWKWNFNYNNQAVLVGLTKEF